MTISQPARPDPAGLPKGRHMMGPTVTTHGLSVSQICPFVSEKQSIRLSLLFGGVIYLFVWFLDFSETCLSSKAVDINMSQIIFFILHPVCTFVYVCVYVHNIKDTCCACCTISLMASNLARSLLSPVPSSLLFSSLV